MNNTMKIIGLLIGGLCALYFNMWYLILPIAIFFGLVSDFGISKTAFVSFFVIFLMWTVALYIKDTSFFRSPSVLLAQAFGGIPSWSLPLIGGAIGGMIALLGSAGGRFLKA